MTRITPPASDLATRIPDGCPVLLDDGSRGICVGAHSHRSYKVQVQAPSRTSDQPLVVDRSVLKLDLDFQTSFPPDGVVVIGYFKFNEPPLHLCKHDGGRWLTEGGVVIPHENRPDGWAYVRAEAKPHSPTHELIEAARAEPGNKLLGDLADALEAAHLQLQVAYDPVTFSESIDPDGSTLARMQGGIFDVFLRSLAKDLEVRNPPNSLTYKLTLDRSDGMRVTVTVVKPGGRAPEYTGRACTTPTHLDIYPLQIPDPHPGGPTDIGVDPDGDVWQRQGQSGWDITDTRNRLALRLMRAEVDRLTAKLAACAAVEGTACRD